jgi:hypothetical protein
MSDWWELVEWESIDQVAQAHRRGLPDRAHLGFGAYLPFHNALGILVAQFDMEERKACDFLFVPMELPLGGDGEVS